jgi:hypothetical protein
MQGARGARKDLDDGLHAHLAEEYRGYLQPEDEEPVAQDGSRAMVCLLDDLARVLKEVSDGDSFTADPEHVNRRRGQRALALFLGVDRHPCSAEQAMWLADESALEQPHARNSGEERRGGILDQAFVDWFPRERLEPRELDGDPCLHVGLVGFEQAMSWLEHPPKSVEAKRLIEAWCVNLSSEAARLVLLLSSLQAASARFGLLGSSNPMGAWYDAHRHEAALRPREKCANCPSSPQDTERCPCAMRSRRLAVGSLNLSKRSLGPGDAGEAAFEIAAWTLTRIHARDWGSQAELAWVLGRYPSKRPRSAPASPVYLKALAPLLVDGPVSPDNLYGTAILLDETADPLMLEQFASIAMATFARQRYTVVAADGAAAARARPKEPDEVVRALASLGRSLAGAFRELRSGVLGDLELRLIGSATGEELKAFEAMQEMPMAEQRAKRWGTAEIAYTLAINRLGVLDVHQQKRWEITEQLHLGRLGGLVLEAEWLMFEKGGLELECTRARRLLARALAISGEEGQIHLALEEIKAIKQEYETRGSPDGAAAPGERQPGALRYTPRWSIMPAIMRARAHVALAATFIGEPRQRDAALDTAHRLLRVLRDRDEVTDRQRWEMLRVELVAVIVNAETDTISKLVDDVVRAGGDDSGDYAALAAAWRAKLPDISPAMARELEAAARRLRAAPILTPRLPDLAVVPLFS